MLQLTWKKQKCALFGTRYDLTGLPEPYKNSAVAYYRPGSKNYIANAHINGRFMSHIAGTLRAAIKRLNAEIDRRSIGLFGVDDIKITQET